jgi:hypothetical protein
VEHLNAAPAFWPGRRFSLSNDGPSLCLKAQTASLNGHRGIIEKFGQGKPRRARSRFGRWMEHPSHSATDQNIRGKVPDDQEPAA